MTYVMSDLHGRYDLYCEMMEKLMLSDDDTLYILGDFVDRGHDGFKILLDVAKTDKRIIPLMGNHDLVALRILASLAHEISDSKLEAMRDLIETWLFDGGKATLDEFKTLTTEEKKLALMTLDSFGSYVEITVNGKDFVLAHAGIGNYEEDKPLCEYNLADFLFTKEDYGKPKFSRNNKYLVTGHTPTVSIKGAEKGRIYKNHDHIAVDCGAVFFDTLGCIRLDDFEEFYVSKHS